MTTLKCALRGLVLALVAALALTPALAGPAATAASSSCESANAKLAKSQQSLRSAQSQLSRQRKAHAQAKAAKQRAKARKLAKAVKRQSRVVNTRSAQVRRDTQARDRACPAQPDPAPGGGTQEEDELGALLKVLASVGGGSAPAIADTTQLRALLNDLQAGLGDQFSGAQLTEMLFGYAGAVPSPSVVAGMLGGDFSVAEISDILGVTPDVDVVIDLVLGVVELLNALAGPEYVPTGGVDAGVLSALLDALLDGIFGGAPIPMP